MAKKSITIKKIKHILPEMLVVTMVLVHTMVECGKWQNHYEN